MRETTATIREFRTDFRAVKRKIEQGGEVVITAPWPVCTSIKPAPANCPHGAIATAARSP